MENASGKYHFFVDSDDIISKNALELLANKLKEDEYDLILADYYKVLPKRKVLVSNYIPIPSNKKAYYKFLLTSKLKAFLWGRLIKREYYIEFAKSFTDNIYEDICFNYFLFKKSKLKVSYINKPIYSYYKHFNSLSNSLNSYTEQMFLYKLFYISSLLDEIDSEKELEKYFSLMCCRHWISFSRMRSEPFQHQEFLKELYYRHYMRVKKELSTQEKLLFLLFYNNHKLGMITNYFFTRVITISANHKLKFLNNKNEPKQKDF